MSSKPGTPGKTPAQAPEAAPVQDLSEQVRVRYEKLGRIRERGENPFKNGFQPTAIARDLHQKYDEKTKAELEETVVDVSVAGRIMAIRDFGKAAFIRLKDRTGLIQLYVAKDKLGEESYAKYREARSR